jgi:tetratricopeptide (TPR) repeat protein
MPSSTPVLFLSAATVDLKDWRDHLHHAFSRAGFRVLTQDQSLRSAPGDVRRLLTETIAEADCVIHLAGMGYGWHATDPFPDAPLASGETPFQCSWTQFEYYHAHQQGKDIIAFVCAPDLSKPGFTEVFDNPAELLLKQRLQEEHRQRVVTGEFGGTPLAGLVPRKSNETIASSGKLMEAVAAAVGTLRSLQHEQIAKAQDELRAIGDSLARLERGQRHTRRWVIASAAVLVLVALGVWAVKRDTQETKAAGAKVMAAQDDAARRDAELASQMARVQDALSKLQRTSDPESDPLSQWPRERLENELARQMKVAVPELRSQLNAGQASVDDLVSGQALLASGKIGEAGDKFDNVLQQENAAVQRLKQAWIGKAQIAYDAARYEEALGYRLKAAVLEDKAAHPVAWAEAQGWVTFILLDLARYKEAEPLLREIADIRKQHLGSQHPDYSIALNQLALLLQSTDRNAEAEPLLRQALAIDEAAHGPHHPDVATALNNLAWILKTSGRLAESEPLMRRALSIDEATYGKDHPHVARDLSNLALLLQDTGRLTEAEPLIRRALVIDETIHGPNHPLVAIRLSNLGAILQSTGRFAEAEPLLRRALQIDETCFGSDHPEVAVDLGNLAFLLRDSGRPAPAEPLLRRALEILVKSHRANGHEHSNHSWYHDEYAALLKSLNLPEPEAAAKLRGLEPPPASR